MKKRVISMLLALALLCGLLPAASLSVNADSDTTIAYPVEGGNIYFNKSNSMIYDCDETVTRAIIPAEIDGLAVTGIGMSAFYHCRNLTDVTIPNSVTSIIDYAFEGCSSLTDVTIPDSVTSMGNSVFYHCSNLTSVKIGDGVTKIFLMAFYDCNSLTDLTIGNNVTEIDSSAFAYCSSLTSVTIPDSVTRIGSSAFAYCSSLTSVTIPDSVTSIGIGAFNNTALYLDETNWAHDVLYIGNHLIKAKTSISGEYEIQDGTRSIADEAFSHCSNLTGVTIPDSVISIGDSAFYYCSSLTGIAIPNGVDNIGSWVFYCCSSLTNATIPDSVTSIGYNAFSNCESLTNITIPDSVASIDDGAFSFCSSLTDVTIPDGVTSIGRSAFAYCSSLTSVTIPDSVMSIGSSAFVATALYLDETNWAHDVLYIGNHLIKAKQSITGEYEIPDGTLTIAEEAFSECINLTGIAIPGSITTIGGAAFYYCLSLIDVTMEDGIVIIDYRAFKDCSKLTDIKIPDTVTTIGHSAFENCSNLTSVTIPDSVMSISNATFSACSSLKTVIIGDGVTDIDINAFENCSSLETLTIGNGVTTIRRSAFGGCSSLTSISIPDSVTLIDSWAFMNCRKLKEATIGSGVAFIYGMAFMNCSSLTDVYFMGDAPEINDMVFFEEHIDDVLGYSYKPIEGITLYYLEGKSGWTSPTWNGYPTATWELPHEHEHTASVTEPTCTQQGYTTYTCACGDSYVADYTAALGHDYADGICSRCGEKDPDYVIAEPVKFDDVSHSAWYASAVDYAVSNNLMNGTGNNKFEPESPMTRAMLVTVLWRYAGEPAEGENIFTDVENDQWYTKAVAWAAENGIVGGVGNGRFDPDGKITREQMAAILYRYSNAEGIDTSKREALGSFPDGDKVSAYATDALSWAVGEGLITGTEVGGKVYLDPQGNATRAQVATILMRYIENVLNG